MKTMQFLKRQLFRLAFVALLPALAIGCKEEDPKPAPTPEPLVTISNVSTEANTVTFTVTPQLVSFYTYNIVSETVTPEPIMVDPATKSTFTYTRLLPASDYTIVVVGYDEFGFDVATAEHDFTTAEGSEYKLTVPTGESPFAAYDEERLEMKSVFYLDEGELLWIFFSPLEGIDNYMDLLYGNGGKNDYLSLCIAPSQLGKTVHMKSASQRYTVVNNMIYTTPLATDIALVSIDIHSSITDGGFILKRDGAQIEGYLEMISAATGKKLRVYGTCTYDEEEANRTSFMSLNDQQAPIGSGYYRFLDEARTASELYLSPASVPMGELIDQADAYHLRLRFNHTMAASKQSIDLSEVDETFELEFYDPATQESILVTKADLQGATGRLSLYRYALQGNYRVEYDLTLGTKQLKGYADGLFDLYSYYNANGYTAGDDQFVALQSAVIDRTKSDYYKIYLAPEAGLTTLAAIQQAEGVIEIEVSPLALTGEHRYFHQEHSANRFVSIRFDGETYTSQELSTKSLIHGAILNQKLVLSFVEEHSGLEGHYAGEFHDVK